MALPINCALAVSTIIASRATSYIAVVVGSLRVGTRVSVRGRVSRLCGFAVTTATVGSVSFSFISLGAKSSPDLLGRRNEVSNVL